VTRSQTAVKTPWHLWLIGIVGLLWNAIGAFDFVMTTSKNETYMSAFASDQLAFFYGLPFWVKVAWAVAVWGGVIGSILLLVRKRQAVMVFLFSFVAALLTTFNNYVLSNGLQVMGDAVSLIFTGVILIIALGLYLYSTAMQRKGLLV
jgi:hypothetical protein